MQNLIIRFQNQQALEHFATWLCGSGEQSYWDWMECREMREAGPITAKEFDYHQDGDFVAGNMIVTKCGRLDNKE